MSERASCITASLQRTSPYTVIETASNLELRGLKRSVFHLYLIPQAGASFELFKAIRYPSPSAVWGSCSSEGICRSSLTALNNLCASSLDSETPSDTDSLLVLKTHFGSMQEGLD